MKTVRKVLQTDKDGVAQVEVHAGAFGRLEVIVSWRELAPPSSDETSLLAKQTELELLSGALADDPIVRPPQPVLESRLPLE